MEILPAIDLRDGKCVRLRQGDYAQETIFGDDPTEMARRWASEGTRWLHLVDLDGAKAGRPVNHEVVRRIVQATGVKCELGGGIRDVAAIRLMLDDVGVERVIIGTQALKQPEWFREMAQRWPGRLVLGIDARDGMVATEGWLDVSKTSAIELAKSYADLDLAAVVYTNIANDGMMQGVDEGTIRDMIALTELGLPVIASGGVTTLRDVQRLADVSREHPKLIGAIIGRAIYEGTIRVAEAMSVVVGDARTSGDPGQWKYPDWQIEWDAKFTIDGLREIASAIINATDLRVELDLFDEGYARVNVFRGDMKIGEVYVNRTIEPSGRIYAIYYGEDDDEFHSAEIDVVVKLLTACRTRFPDSE